MGGKSLRVERANWLAMKYRCLSPKHMHYALYGGRGITVCKAWLESFETFLRDMGPRPSPKHSLDRIDTLGNYEPGNVRWATVTEQMRNRGAYNYRITAFGVTRTLSEWAALYDQWPNTIKKRLAFGWTPEDAVSTVVTQVHRRRAA